ncbi:MAG: redox-sensing transcriptional repressor Rex [Syntrophomonadaceae bacterium]|nr:redox-sensing transcriptional repressor Rex [Syntrophomonadaceae bacterium]
MKVYKISEATITRLSIYSRFLKQLLNEQLKTVSSGEIAKGVGVSSAQVRKDLAYFGEFGMRGVGYKVDELYGYIIKILGLNHAWNTIIIGAGKLGSALALYQGFIDRGFRIKAILDIEKKIIGTHMMNIQVDTIDTLAHKVQENDISIGILTVPADAAQEVTDQLVAAGIKAILNFSPKVLKVPDNVILRHVDFSVNLEILSFNLTHDKYMFPFRIDS